MHRRDFKWSLRKMPKITVPQKTTLPGTDVGPKIPIGIFDDQFAAQQGLAEAIGQAGQLAAASAINTIRAQGAEESTSARLDYATAFREFQPELLKSTDYSTYGEKFNAWHDAFTAERIKKVNHKGAARRTQKEFDYQRAVRGRTIDSDAQTKLVRETRRTLSAKIDAFVSEELGAETPEEIKKANTERKEYFQELTDTGVLNEGEAALLENQYQTVKATALDGILTNKYLTTAQMIAAADPENGPADAAKWLLNPENTPGIEAKKRQELQSSLKTTLDFQDQQAKIRLTAAQEEDRGTIYDGLADENFDEQGIIIPVTRDMIEATALGENEQQKLWKMTQEKYEAAAGAKNLRFLQSDPEIRADFWQRILRGTDVPGPDELADKVGAGLSIDDSKEMKAAITNPIAADKGAAVDSAYQFSRGQLVSITQSALDALLTGEATTFKEAADKRKDELWNWDQYTRALNVLVRDNPEWTSDDIYVKSRGLLVTYRRTLEQIQELRIEVEDSLAEGTIPEGRTVPKKKKGETIDQYNARVAGE